MILNLTQKTVENYLGIIRKKLNVHKTLQAVIKAIELELIRR
jgi:DNA-binding CsgD family transcriptional regulator